MTAVSSQLTAFETTVNALQQAVTDIQNALDDLPDNSEAISEIGSNVAELSEELANAQTAIASLTAQLENVNSAEELAQISSTLADIEDDVHELLQSDAVINQNITINNEATLQYAENLVGTETDDPNVIVNGSVTVEITPTNFDAAQIARVNAITAKLATVLQAVSITNNSSPTVAVELPNLTFIDDNYSVIGSAANDEALRTVSGILTIDHGGAADYSTLSSVGSNVIVDGAVTSLDLSGVDINGSLWSQGAAAGTLILPAATSVNVGTALVNTASLTLAETVHLGFEGDISTRDVIIEAPVANTITFNATRIAVTNGDLIVTADADGTTFNAPNFTNATHPTIAGEAQTVSITAQTANLNRLEGVTNGSITITAETVNLDALSSISTSTVVINTAETVNLPELIIPTSATVTATDATTLSIKSGSHTNLNAPDVETLTIGEQGNLTDFSTAGYANLETFTIDGAVNDNPTLTNVTNTITITGASLESATIGGMIFSVVVTDTGALESLTTAGNIRIFRVNNADDLTSITIGHDHIDGADEAAVHFTGNAELTSVDLSSINDVGLIEITDNPELTAITAPATSPITEVAATIIVTVTGNGLQGTYTAASAFVTGTGTTPDTPAVNSTIAQASIYGLRLWLEAHYSHTASPTWNIEIDEVDSDDDGDFDDGDYATVAAADANNTTDDGNNQIDTVAELNTVRRE